MSDYRNDGYSGFEEGYTSADRRGSVRRSPLEDQRTQRQPNGYEQREYTQRERPQRENPQQYSPQREYPREYPQQRETQRDYPQRDYTRENVRDYSRQNIPQRSSSSDYYRQQTSQTRSSNYYSRMRAVEQERKSSGFSAWLSQLSDRRLTAVIAGVVLLAVVGVLLCIILQSSCSCASCEKDDGVIPVVEQGDGTEGGESEATRPTEVVSTGDGLITIDEDVATDSFTVTVTNADGSYGRTKVSRDQAATLRISDQNETGFAFTMDVTDGGVTGSLSGQAYFCAADEAVYEGAAGMLNFRFGSSGVTVYMTDSISAFGDMSPDGLYVAGTPSYLEDEMQAAQEAGLDADVRNSEAVRSALTSMLTPQDLTLLDFIFQNGTVPVYHNSEFGYDSSGAEINIDAELNAVKYYGFIDGTGESLVLICTGGGKVYAGICDGTSYRYYTNDPAYAQNAPRAIALQASSKDMTVTYMTAD